ncbi:MAG: hypothetical protein NXH70_02690 [Hyphomonas sp.]|nr:hypothetical protein [Hyphomonas sp.]
MSRLPKYIALCGWPKSGKDEVAKILASLLDARVIDDGEPLRFAAPRLFGYDANLPYTQEGKATLIDTPEGKITVRQSLGDLGKHLEATHGHEFMAWRAIRETERYSNPHFIFPSVRRSSASAFKGLDSIVIEVRRPGYDSSPHDFDWYDPAHIDYVIHNDGDVDQLHQLLRWFAKFGPSEAHLVNQTEEVTQ